MPELTIDDLNLLPVAHDAALILKSRCPWVQFTSGRRDWFGQAHAMAVNVLQAKHNGNPNWLAQVYPREPQLQCCVDENADVSSVDALANLLYLTLKDLPESLRLRFAHPAGRAFDVESPFDYDLAMTLQAEMKALPKIEVVLTNEGGLHIYHAQFVVPSLGDA